ncbi:Uncharacterised protein [Halioglobus japonicus]|nr:Uncharacterised protein [Halioglobus japonicus]
MEAYKYKGGGTMGRERRHQQSDTSKLFDLAGRFTVGNRCVPRNAGERDV